MRRRGWQRYAEELERRLDELSQSNDLLTDFLEERERQLAESDDIEFATAAALEAVGKIQDQQNRRLLTARLVADALGQMGPLAALDVSPSELELDSESVGAQQLGGASLVVAHIGWEGLQDMADSEPYVSKYSYNDIRESAARGHIPLSMFNDGDELVLHFAVSGSIRKSKPDANGLIGVSNKHRVRTVTLSLIDARRGLALIVDDSANDEWYESNKNRLAENEVAVIGTHMAYANDSNDAQLVQRLTRGADLGYLQPSGYKFADLGLELYWVQRGNEELM